MSWAGSENRWLTRRFDQYALIVFWRMLDFDATCCLSTGRRISLVMHESGKYRREVELDDAWCNCLEVFMKYENLFR